MSKLFNVFAAILLIVGSCFVVSDSHAKVCFLGEDCGSGGNFTGTAPVNLADECIREGYIERSKCKATEYIAEYCPFSSNYGTCCPRENKFASCVYPLQKSGNACGGKYKCVCDRTAYKYTVEKCRNIDGSGGKNKAIPGGAACAEEVLNSDGNGFYIDTYYTECRCDRALYPYTPDMCDKNTTIPQDGICVAIDANNNKSEYYASCYCDRQKYKHTSAGCFPFVGDENKGKCSSGGADYYESCKDCSGWPARDLENVGKNGAAPADDAYEACPYAQTDGYYKILRCDNPGYRVSKSSDPKPDGGYYQAGEKCVPIECEQAVKEYLKANGSTSYAIFDGTKLIDGNGNKVTSSGRTAIVVKDLPSVGAGSCSTTQIQPERYHYVGTSCNCYKSNNTQMQTCVAYTDGVSCSSGQYRCCKSTDKVVDSKEKRAYTHGGLGCVPSYTYISGPRFAQMITAKTDWGKAVKVACTKKPTITYTGSNFPYYNQSTNTGNTIEYTNSDVSGGAYTTKFYGIDFKFNASATMDNRTLYFYNSMIEIPSSYKVTLNGSTYLYRNTSYPNKDDTVVKIFGTLQSNSYLYSSYYQFNPKSLKSGSQGNIIFTTTSISKTMGQIYLDVDQQFAVKNIYITPKGQGVACPPRECGTEYKSAVYFYGPTSGNANVYSNAFIGYNPSSEYGKAMYIKLSRSLVWNLYDSTNSYEITLTPGSYIQATDYDNGGYVSRIKRSDSENWKKCSMASGWKVIGMRRNDCDEIDNGDNHSPVRSDQNLVCKISKSGTISKVDGRALVVGLDLADDDLGTGYKQYWDSRQLGMYAFNAIYECRKGENNYADLKYGKYDSKGVRETLGGGEFSGCNYHIKEMDGKEDKWSNGPFLSCQ